MQGLCGFVAGVGMCGSNVSLRETGVRSCMQIVVCIQELFRGGGGGSVHVSVRQ